MTRSNARELAVHLVFQLRFSDILAADLLSEDLKSPVYELIGHEEHL